MNNDQTSSSHSPLAALAILDHLQSTGERDRLKEWLISELTSRGWVDTLHDKAHQIAKAHVSTTEQPLTTTQLAAKLSADGHGKLAAETEVLVITEVSEYRNQTTLIFFISHTDCFVSLLFSLSFINFLPCRGRVRARVCAH